MFASRVVAVCAVLGLVVGAAVWPAGAEAPRSTPGASPAGGGTPAAGDPGGLLAMLGRAPDVLAPGGAPPEGEVARWADVAAQLAATGQRPPASIAEAAGGDWLRALTWLPLPDPLASNVLLEEFRPTFGFDATQVDQALAVGAPPEVLTLFRGRFDPAELRAAWERAGYRRLEEGRQEVWSLAEEAAFSFDSPVQRLALARFNNAALLPDGTLAYAPTLDGLRAVLAVAAGRAPSLAERPEVAETVAAASPDLAAGLLVTGGSLRGTITPPFDPAASPGVQVEAVATMIAEGEAQLARMPPIRLALLGITAGGPLPFLAGDGTPTPTPPPDGPLARIEIAALVADRDAAETAAATTAERLETALSFQTRQPFAELFPERETAVAPEGAVFLVRLRTGGPNLGIVFQLFAARDLVFLAW